MEAINVAIFGIDPWARAIIDLIAKSDRLKLVGICDARRDALHDYDVDDAPWELFTDPREMILRGNIQILIVWKGSVGDGLIETAIENGIWPVLRPTGQNGIERSVQLLELAAEKKNVGVFTWAPWLFSPTLDGLTTWVVPEQMRSILSRFAVSDADLDLPIVDEPLKAVAYPSAFIIEKWLGLPEQVYCHDLVRSSQDSQTPIQYHCTVTLLYSQTVATIFASLNTGAYRHQIVVHGTGGTVELDMTQAVYHDAEGQLGATGETYTQEQSRTIANDRMLNALWQAYVEQRRESDFDLKRHIGVMAALEAALLSARTGHAEELVKVAELGGILGTG